MKSRKKTMAILVGCLFMMLSTPTFAAAGVWEKIMKALGLDSGVPCWSSADCPEGCTHSFTRCSGCVTINGIQDGTQSTC